MSGWRRNGRGAAGRCPIAVLCGACLHAVWNLFIRSAADKDLNTVLVAGGAGVWAACGLPLVPLPAAESWPYLIASVFVHVVYFSFVARLYRGAELSFAYPLMRFRSGPLGTGRGAAGA